MHKINKTRLLAGLPIDASYERRQHNQADENVSRAPNTVVEQPQTKSMEDMLVESIGDISNLSLQDLNAVATLLQTKVDQIHESIASKLSEAKVFKRGTDVEDKKGRCYKIVKVVGVDDHNEPYYEVVCPKTGEVERKSGMTLHVAAKKESVEPVAERSNVDVIDFTNSPDQPKTPAVVVPQPQKTKIPVHVTKDLQRAIAEFKRDAETMKHRDEANAVFHQQIADAMVDLEQLMKTDIKAAQIFLSSLMGPILHKIPSSVCKFVYSGGDTSLKTYFNK